VRQSSGAFDGFALGWKGRIFIGAQVGCFGKWEIRADASKILGGVFNEFAGVVRCESGRGLPQSKSWRAFVIAPKFRGASWECASPLALLDAFNVSKARLHEGKDDFTGRDRRLCWDNAPLNGGGGRIGKGWKSNLHGMEKRLAQEEADFVCSNRLFTTGHYLFGTGLKSNLRAVK
jgi:hypothetical protein